MGEANKIATLVGGLPIYDGRERCGLPSWKEKLRAHLSLGATRSFKILQGTKCPNLPGDADTVDDSADIIHPMQRERADNNYIHSVLFLATNNGTQRSVERFQGTSLVHGAGDGRAAWLACVDAFKEISNAGQDLDT